MSEIKAAVKQVCLYKKEFIVAAFALLVLSAGTVLMTRKIEALLPRVSDFAAPASHPVFLPLLLALGTAASICALVWALLRIARPFKARIVLGRLSLLFLSFVFVTGVKGVALGYFARLVFAGDNARFDMAKTAVDHSSALLALFFTAALFVFLVACLKEEKLVFVGFWKSFAVLCLWVLIIELPKLVLFFAFGPHLALSILAAILSVVATLWYFALALALHMRATSELAEGKSLADDVDPESDFEKIDPDLEEER